MDGYELGQRIADLRKGEGESQEQLAASLGEVRETVKHWENGTRQLKAEAIVKLASHFNVSSDYLLGLREGKSTDMTVQGVADFTGLSEEAVKNLEKTKKDPERLFLIPQFDKLLTCSRMPEVLRLMSVLEEKIIFAKGIRSSLPVEELLPSIVEPLDGRVYARQRIECQNNVDYVAYRVSKEFNELIETVFGVQKMVDILNEDVKRLKEACANAEE